MNNLNVFKRFIGSIVLIFTTILYADQTAVSFTNFDTYNIDVSAQSVKYDSNHIYVANGTKGILIFEENNTSLNSIYSTIIDSKNIIDIAIKDNFIFALAENTGLYVLDFNGTNINIVSNLLISGDLNSIEVKNDYLYIANGTNGLLAVDVTNKSLPQSVATLTTTDAKKLLIKENILYLADDWGGLRTIDITTSNLPSIVATNNDGTFIDLDIDGNKLFVIAKETVQAYDVSKSILPLKKDTLTLTNEATSVFAYSSNVYIGTTLGSIVAYDTNDLTALTLSDSYATPSVVNDFVIYNSLAYIANDISINLAEFNSDFSNTISEAVGVGQLPVTINGSLPISENDIDILQIDITNFGILSIDLITDIENLKYSVLDVDGLSRGDINHTINGEDGLRVSLDAGTYYVKVESTGGYGDYEISMSDQGDDYSDDISGAALVHFGENISGTIESVTDKDIFKVYASAKGVITVTGSIQLEAELYTNSSEEYIAGEGSVESGISFHIPCSGYYFIELTSTTPSYNYNFNSTLTKDSKSAYEDEYRPSLKNIYESSSISGKAVALNNLNLFVSNGLVLEKRELSAQTLLGSVNADNYISDIEVIGDYAYLAIGLSGIAIYDIRGNTPIKTASLIINNSDISKIVVDGKNLYAYNGSKLYIVDIANKNSPELLAPTTGVEIGYTINDIGLKYSMWNRDGEAVKTRNSYIYLGTQNGLKVYSVDDNILLDTYDNETSSISRLIIDNSRLYTTQSDLLNIYDISVPVYSSKLGTVNIGTSNNKEMVVDSNHIYLSPYIRVVNIDDETAPVLINNISTSLDDSLLVRDGKAFVIGLEMNLSVYEVAYDYSDSRVLNNNGVNITKYLDLNSEINGSISNIVNQYAGLFDIDYFELNVTTSGTMDVNFTTDASLVGPNINSMNVSPGIYSISMRGTTPSDDGNYTLFLKFTEDDYSDIISDATFLSFDSPKEGNLSVESDKDYMKVELTQRGTLEVILSGNTGAKIEIIDIDKVTHYEKDYNTDDLDSYTVKTTLNPGVYYILVSGKISTNLGTYTLEAKFTPSGEMVLDASIDYDYLIYGKSVIYTVLGNKMNVYSHILNKTSQKDFNQNIDDICSKPIVVGDSFYYNKIDDSNKLNCDKTELTLTRAGYVRVSLNFNEDEQFENTYTNRNYIIKKNEFIQLESTNYFTSSLNSIASLDENTTVIIGYKDISTYDVRNKKNISILDNKSQRDIKNIITSANYMYVLDRDRNYLIIYEISDKSNPQFLSELYVENIYSRDMKLDGNYLFLASDNGLINVVDVSDKESPIIISNGIENRWETIYDIEINGNYLYARKGNGFYILDISNPQNPVEISSYISQYEEYSEYFNYETNTYEGYYYTVDRNFNDFKYSSNNIYMAGDNLSIVDVTNPSNPVIKDEYSQLSGLEKVDVNTTHIFLSDYSNLYLLSKVDAQNDIYPTNSTYMYNIYDLNVDGSNIYVAQSSGYSKYSTSNLTNIYTSSEATSYNIDKDINGYLYVANGHRGFSIYLDNDNNITDVYKSDYFYTQNNFQDIKIKDSIAYIANDESQRGLKVYDLTNPKDIQLITVINENNESMNKINIYENNMFVSNNRRISKYDISIPSSPTKSLSQDYGESSFIDMLVDGEYIYIIESGETWDGYNYILKNNLVIANVSDLSFVAVLDLNNYANDLYSIQKKDNAIYIGTQSGLVVVNAQNVFNPEYITQLYFDVNIKALCIDGNSLYSGSDSRLIKYDLTDPLLPKKVEIASEETTMYNSWYDQYGVYQEDTYIQRDESKFATNYMHIFGNYMYTRKNGSSSEYYILNLNSKHEKSYDIGLSGLNIVHADSNYIYEYGQASVNIFGEASNDTYINRMDSANEDYNAPSRGAYKIDSLSVIQSLGDVVFIGNDNKLEVVEFNEDNVPNVKYTIDFSNSIEQLEVLEDKKILYIHLKDSNFIKVYDFKDLSNLEKLQEFDTYESINHMSFTENKVYVSAPEFGVRSFFTDENGLLVDANENYEHIGVDIDDVNSVDNSTFNYTAQSDSNVTRRSLKVFMLKENLTDSVSDSVYTQSKAGKAPKEGCFIATAAYGSYFEKHVKVLRDFRDEYLMTNELGREFVKFYYIHSPSIADNIAQNNIAKTVVRVGLTPIVYLLKYPLYLLSILFILIMFFAYKRGMMKLLLSILIGSFVFSGCKSESSYEEEILIEQSIVKGVGYFVDSPVEGVFYSSGKLNGKTDENGTFEYDNTPDVDYNTDVHFTLGNIKLGSIKILDLNEDKFLFPTDLAGVDRNDTANSNVVAMVQLLQTLDVDNNVSNGIKIGSLVQNTLEQSDLNFIDSNITQTDMLSISTIVEKPLVAKEIASAHLEDTLNTYLGLNIDNTPPVIPSITSAISITNQNLISVELSGEINATIFVNGIQVGLISSNGLASINLDTSGADGEKVFSITLKDELSNESDSLLYSVNKDTTSPIVSSEANLTAIESSLFITKIEASDINEVSFSLSGADADLLYVNKITGELFFKTYPLYNDKPFYYLVIEVSDSVNISTQDLNISILNPSTPYVNDVSPPSNGTFGINGDLFFNLYTNESVSVTGIPRLILTIDGVTKYATYDSPSSYSDMMSFRYTIDEDDLLGSVYVDPKIELNGATIKDYEDLDIFLNFDVPDLEYVKVDTTLHIISASYYDSNTPEVSDDKLFINYNKEISEGSIPSNLASAFAVTGTGFIGEFSTSEYNPETFIQTISLDLTSTAFIPNSTSISLSTGVITDLFSNSARTTTNIVTVNKADDYGNDFQSAGALDSNLSASIEEGGDVDYFKIIVPSYGELRVYTTGDLNTYGELYNIYGSYLTSASYGGTDNNFGFYMVLTAGEYYIRVSSSDGYTTGSYSLHQEFVPYNNPPSITSPDIINIDENNESSSIQIIASDSDYDSLTYSISGVDFENFYIDMWTGLVTFVNVPDYETKDTYQFSVTVNDYTDITTQDITVNINNIPELKIRSAVYDNNKTTTVLDDRLFIYYSDSINEASIAADTSSNFELFGSGAIGSASLSDYNDTNFHKHTISLNSNGTTSAVFIPYDTNISLAQNVISDIYGDSPIPQIQTVEAFSSLKKTGQIKSFEVNGTEIFDGSIKDDGYYQSGVDTNYTRSGDIVTDEITGLMWQDDTNVSIITKQWLIQANYDTCSFDYSSAACPDTSGDTAESYCSDLTLGGFTNWRLPTIQELRGIVDYSMSYPSINSIFINGDSNYYWSSNTSASYSLGAWIIYFGNGNDEYYDKSMSNYIRCVRTQE